MNGADNDLAAYLVAAFLFMSGLQLGVSWLAGVIEMHFSASSAIRGGGRYD